MTARTSGISRLAAMPHLEVLRAQSITSVITSRLRSTLTGARAAGLTAEQFYFLAIEKAHPYPFQRVHVE